MKHVLVTGGSRGLGLGVCRRLLKDGYRVTASSRRLSPELQGLVEAYPGQIAFIPADFSDPKASRALAKSACVIDGVDGFVANAAIATEGLITLSTEASIAECIQINLLAPMLLAREVVKGMLARGGSLVFVSSVAAKTGFPGLAAYSAAKGGLVSFSRALAREYGEKGIRSNAVLPGFFESEMTRSLPDRDRERVRRRTTLKRLGCDDEIVEAIAFLLSDAARYITGTELAVDGGLTA